MTWPASDACIVRVKRLSMTATMPTRGSADAVGWDIYYAGERPFMIFPHATEKLPTGIAIEIPAGWECQFRSRSGLALKGVSITNSPGTIDPDYRGELFAILTNHDRASCMIYPQDRIGQLVFKRVPDVSLVEVDELSDTGRGAGGFGSTGR